MNEVDFRNWLAHKGKSPKVISDTISRLKKIEKEIENCDIDEQYRRDRCQSLLCLFLDMGRNDGMKKYPNAKFPIGKYYMSTYRYAIKQYIQFLESVTLNTV